MAVCLDKALLGLGGAALDAGIDKLAELIKNAISKARPPGQTLPPFLTSIEGMSRSGLSAISLTSNIVSRLGEAGIDTGTMPDGSEPQMTKFIRIMSEEIIKEFQLNMKIVTEIPPGVQIGMAGNVPVLTAMPVQGEAIGY